MSDFDIVLYMIDENNLDEFVKRTITSNKDFDEGDYDYRSEYIEDWIQERGNPSTQYRG